MTSNADVPDLGEMFVQEHQKAEGAGWLLGSGAVDLTDREATESRSNGRQQQSRRPEPDEGVDPSQVNQLRMF